MTEQHTAYVVGLRELADHLERHPELIPTYSAVTLHNFAADRADFAQLTSALGGQREKAVDDDYYTVRRTFGPHNLEVVVNREKVCRKVVIGERTIAARPAEPERVEEIVEWVCEEPILAGLEAAQA